MAQRRSSGSTRTPFPQAHHHLPKSSHHFTFSSSHPPAIRIRPSEPIHVETWDCFRGAFDRCATAVQAEGVKVEHDALNPVTGPIFVVGAEPGDTLSVTIHEIRPNERGVARCGPDCGQLRELVRGDCTRFFRVEDGVVTMQEEEGGEDPTTSSDNGADLNGRHRRRRRREAPITFPSRPMLGVIGVAPSGDAPISTMPAGKHGGNLDSTINGPGTTLHLPVSHPGGLLSIGDMHASQGDGEIIGTGIEIGGHVLLSCDIIKGVQASAYPISETPTHWMTYGVTTMDIPGATTVACREAATLLMEQWGFSPEDASIFLGVRGDLGLCQAVHPDKGTQIAKILVPKLEVCPGPFRVCPALDEGREGH